MRVLIAEDEVEIAKALRIMLESQKYSVDVVHSGTDAWEYIQVVPYDVLVLDIMMPGLDGISVLQKARESGNTTPAMLLTAKSEVEDRVAGLNAGADDYLPKPFAMAEFVARVKALSRRSGHYAPVSLRIGRTQLNCSTYELCCGEQNVRLNNKEFQMMELFMRNPRIVFSTEKLMDRIWGLDAEASVDVVWAYVAFLRKKLNQLASDVEIKTVRGAGYLLEERKC